MLETYERPPDPQQPVVCWDEKPVTLHAEVRPPTPAAPFAVTADQVTVTIGALPATVLFAGLTPGLASLYQVNAVVPQGVATGEVDVEVSIAGQTSPVVTLFVE